MKNKPQVAKDLNNYNKPERSINEFEQVPMKRKESSPPLWKFFFLPQKNIETNKAKEKVDLKQERKRKTIENEKLNLEKILKKTIKIKWLLVNSNPQPLSL